MNVKTRKVRRIVSTPEGEQEVDAQALTITDVNREQVENILNQIDELDLLYPDITIRGFKGTGKPVRIGVFETDRGYVQAPDPEGFLVEKLSVHDHPQRKLKISERRAVSRAMEYPKEYKPVYKRGRTIGFVGRTKTVWKEIP